MRIRPEEAADIPAIRAVHLAAFETSVEADLVDALRDAAAHALSLVAADHGTIVGHILFSAVTLTESARARVLGLAPMAVMPARHRQGFGSALVRHGLAGCRALGADGVVVLGHPGYYPRFGFERASRFELRCEYDVPDEVFMALELSPGALGRATGTVRYHRVFPR